MLGALCSAHHPWWIWGAFILLIIVFLAMDLFFFHRKSRAVSIKEALVWFGVWFAAAMVFNIWIYFQCGTDMALQFFTGYLIEKSLSIDNLFVFLVIFTAFGIDPKYQHRVLFWGILGAIITRSTFILLGSALVERFSWVFYIFGLTLIYAAWKMQFSEERKFDPKKSQIVRAVRILFPVSDTMHGDKFFTKENGQRAVTVLFLALIVIELSDIVFAFDSIPAIFAITTDPFIVFTSNIFAILGLRSLYFVLANLQSLFEYLKTGLSIILLFIGVKLLARDFFHIPVLVSLLFILFVLVICAVASLVHHRKAGRMPAAVDGQDGGRPVIAASGSVLGQDTTQGTARGKEIGEVNVEVDIPEITGKVKRPEALPPIPTPPPIAGTRHASRKQRSKSRATRRVTRKVPVRKLAKMTKKTNNTKNISKTRQKRPISRTTKKKKR